MAQKRPTAVVLVAIFQLVFGILGMSDSVLAFAGAEKALASATQFSAPGQARFTQQDLENHWTERLPSYRLIKPATTVVSLVFSLWMIGAAVGLLRMRTWGWSLTLAYAVADILVTEASAVYAFAVLMPVALEFFRAIPATANPEGAGAVLAIEVGNIAGFVIGALTVIYPVLVLVVLLRPSIRAAFRGEELSSEPEDYRDTVPPGSGGTPDATPPAGDR